MDGRGRKDVCWIQGRSKKNETDFTLSGKKGAEAEAEKKGAEEGGKKINPPSSCATPLSPTDSLPLHAPTIYTNHPRNANG
jgi:hypothetical protein